MTKEKSIFMKARVVLVLSGLLFFTSLSEAKGWKPLCGLVYTIDQIHDLQKGKDPLKNYRRGLEENGGIVVEFSPLETPKECEKKLDTLHGLLLPGGSDVAPDYYGEDPHPYLEEVDRQIDRLEIYLINQARERNIPTLGICRGLQVLNVGLGGSLYQDIPAQFKGSSIVIHRKREQGKSQPCYHDVFISPNSLMRKFFPDLVFHSNTYHHQGIKELGEGLQATGRSEDGLIEMIEGTGKWFVLAVQFHPEKVRDSNPPANYFFQVFFEKISLEQKHVTSQ